MRQRVWNVWRYSLALSLEISADVSVVGVDSPSVLDATVERLKAVKSVGLDAGLDFHGRLHKPMAKQLAKALEPYRPLFIEEPLLPDHPEAYKQLSQQTTIPIALGERLFTRWVNISSPNFEPNL